MTQSKADAVLWWETRDALASVGASFQATIGRGELLASRQNDWGNENELCLRIFRVRASRAAAGAGKRGAVKNPQTTLWAAREADSARNSTWFLTAEACRWPLKQRRARRMNRRNSRP
jgi:hypothetical protein